MQSPIIVKKEEKVYSSHVLDVFKNAVIKSDGKESVFSSARIRDGVSVLPIDEKGYAYLIDGYYFGIKKRLTATVSGGIDNGEKPLHAAKRELKEELGIEAKEWISIGRIVRIPSIVSCSASLFVAKNLRFGNPHREPDEDIRMVKMKFSKAFEMVLKNRILDECSSTLILKAKEILGV